MANVSFRMLGDNQGYIARIKAVITNLSFVTLCLTLSGLFFVVTGIQYWLPSYLKEMFGKEVLGEEEGVDDYMVNFAFAFTCFTAPILGAVAGGVTVTKMGGYNTVRAQTLQYYMSACAVACALPIPFLNSFGLVVTLCWFLIFFGGFVLPTVTGIMINTVPPNQKTSANSLANLAYNLIGYLPAPAIYGAVRTATGSQRIALGSILYLTLIIQVLVVVGIRRKLYLEAKEKAMLRSRSSSLKSARESVKDNISHTHS